MSAGVANIIVSRAGSTIFEIANWGTPSIIIPITESAEDHQRKNAFTYARAGACIVIEEKNLTPNLLISEIDRIINDPAKQEKMKIGSKQFATPNAARIIAEGIINTALKHET